MIVQSSCSWRMLEAVLVCLLSITARSQNAQPHYGLEVEKKIEEVEYHLGPWVQIKDSGFQMHLEDRMRYYHVRGVSIAVIHDFKMEWARGYGWADRRMQICKRCPW